MLSKALFCASSGSLPPPLHWQDCSLHNNTVKHSATSILSAPAKWLQKNIDCNGNVVCVLCALCSLHGPASQKQLHDMEAQCLTFYCLLFYHAGRLIDCVHVNLMFVYVCLQVWQSSLPLRRLSWGPGPLWMATSPMMTHMMKTFCLPTSPPHRAQVSTHTHTQQLIYVVHIVPFLSNAPLHALFSSHLLPPSPSRRIVHCPSALVFIFSWHFFFFLFLDAIWYPSCKFNIISFAAETVPTWGWCVSGL